MGHGSKIIVTYFASIVFLVINSNLLQLLNGPDENWYAVVFIAPLVLAAYCFSLFRIWSK